MKRKFLRIFAGMLAVSFAFGASGCELVDTVKSWFDKEEQESATGTADENAAFAKMKADAAALSEYKGALTVTTVSEASMKVQGESGGAAQEVTITENAVRSIDLANKKGFCWEVSEQLLAGDKETLFETKEKLFTENGKYYSYYWDKYDGEEEYSEVSSGKVNESFTSATLDALSLNLYDSELGGYFLADNFDELKKAHVDVYKESIEKQKAALQKINDSIEEQKKMLNKNSSTYAEQCAALDANKKNLDAVKADVSLTAFEENGATTLKIVNDMATDSIMGRYPYDENKIFTTLKQEQTIKTKDGKFLEYIINEYIIKMDATREAAGATSSLSRTTTMTFDYSFNQQKYDEMTVVLPDESKIKSEETDSEVTFHVKVGDKEVVQSGDVREYSYKGEEITTALQALTDLQDRYFGASVTVGQKVYVNAERTQEFDVDNSSVEDLLEANELYIEVTVNDGYALLFMNGVTEKDVTAKKYKIVPMVGNTYRTTSDSDFGFRSVWADPYVTVHSVTFDDKFELQGFGQIEKEYSEIYANGEKLSDNTLVYESKGFYIIDRVAEIEELNPTVFNVFYSYGLY